MTNYKSEIRFIELPKSVGGYRITPNFHIHLQHKPKWFTRKMHQLLLNWEWFDIEEKTYK